jgi:gluconokinase
MVGVSDRGTPKEVTPEATADQVTEVDTSSSQIVVKSARADSAGVRTILVVLGVSGSGKTTIAKTLADRLGWAFEEGDDLHPGSDITKMRSGHPLDDRDRWPWLEKVAAWIDGWRQAGKSGVITCSALKRSYRDFLVRGRPDVRLLYLSGDIELIAARLAARKGHFMPAGLLASQFKTLEPPTSGERAVTVSIDATIGAIVDEIIRQLKLHPA